MRLIIQINNLDKAYDEVNNLINKLIKISNIKEASNTITDKYIERVFVETKGKQ